MIIVTFTEQEPSNTQQLNQLASELIELATSTNERRLVLSFVGVSVISSLMLTKLVLLQRECRKNHIQLQMCDIGPAVYAVFCETKLNRLFQIIPTIDNDPTDPKPSGVRVTDDSKPITRFIKMKYMQDAQDQSKREA